MGKCACVCECVECAFVWIMLLSVIYSLLHTLCVFVFEKKKITIENLLCFSQLFLRIFCEFHSDFTLSSLSPYTRIYFNY